MGGNPSIKLDQLRRKGKKPSNLLVIGFRGGLTALKTNGECNSVLQWTAAVQSTGHDQRRDKATSTEIEEVQAPKQDLPNPARRSPRPSGCKPEIVCELPTVCKQSLTWPCRGPSVEIPGATAHSACHLPHTPSGKAFPGEGQVTGQL